MTDNTPPAVPTSSASEALANMKARAEAAVAQELPAEAVETQLQKLVEADAKSPKYQHYAHARGDVKTITDKGVMIAFIGGQFITKDPAIIEWLNGQIDVGGLPGLTKGAYVTVAEADPMVTLRRQIIAEHEALKVAQAAALAEEQASAPGVGTTGVLSSSGVATS